MKKCVKERYVALSKAKIRLVQHSATIPATAELLSWTLSSLCSSLHR